MKKKKKDVQLVEKSETFIALILRYKKSLLLNSSIIYGFHAFSDNLFVLFSILYSIL